MNKCPRCGRPCQPNDRFCMICGMRLVPPGPRPPRPEQVPMPKAPPVPQSPAPSVPDFSLSTAPCQAVLDYAIVPDDGGQTGSSTPHSTASVPAAPVPEAAATVQAPSLFPAPRMRPGVWNAIFFSSMGAAVLTTLYVLLQYIIAG